MAAPKIFQPSIGQLPLTNIFFVVSDNELPCENLLIGLPVLQHLKIDSRILLDSWRDSLDGMDCIDVGNSDNIHPRIGQSIDGCTPPTGKGKVI